MAQIGRPPLVAQPQYPAPIDWNNPLSRGLVFSFDAVLGSPRNQVGGKLGEAFGTGVAQAHGRYGREITFSGSQGNRSCSFGNTFGKLDNATQATWEFLVKFNEVAAAPHFFGDWDFNQNWLIQRNGTGLIWVAADDASFNRRRWDASSLFSAAGYYHVILSWQGGANFTAWVNGVDKSASFSVVSNAATQMGTTGAIDYIQFGTVNGGTALNGSMVFARIWNRGLSANECRMLSENPWQVFQPQTRAFLSSIAGGAVTGSLAWTESDDAYSLSGTVLNPIAGALNWTEANDGAALSGSVISSGALNWTEANDGAALSGSVISSGALAWNEANDSYSISGTTFSGASGIIDWNESDDVYSISGIAPSNGAGVLKRSRVIIGNKEYFLTPFETSDLLIQRAKERKQRETESLVVLRDKQSKISETKKPALIESPVFDVQAEIDAGYAFIDRLRKDLAKKEMQYLAELETIKRRQEEEEEEWLMLLL